MKVDEFHFSTSFSIEDADALLCEWAPYEELLSFSGPKAWYCCEPTTHGLFKTAQWKSYLQQLKSTDFLYHAHPDVHYRVPHITLENDICLNFDTSRLNKAVAVVSNSGGPPYRRDKHMSQRLKFVTHPMVELFGKQKAWQKFRFAIFSKPQLPSNYQGEVPGYWTDQARFELMARYKAVVCFENTSEPYYFTEKFVGAVQAGCIPIYHAHKSVKESILKGAIWVDPAEFKNDVNATIQYALNADLQKYQEINSDWIKSRHVKETSAYSVFKRIGEILYQQS